MYISGDKSFNDFGNEKALVWHETNIPYAIWSPEGSRSHRILYDPSEVLVSYLLFVCIYFTTIVALCMIV